MKTLIIGAGLIGVTSAYCLRQRGYDVTILDREEGPARDTSFANGALLTPSMSDPWNAPGCWRILLASLGRSDSPMQLRLKALPTLGRWGPAFLLNSRRSVYERNTLNNLRLARYSMEVMTSLRDRTDIDYGRSARGTLRLFRDPTALEQAVAAALRLQSAGLNFQTLTATETIELEPSLVPIAAQLAGAIHYPMDETGDAHRFCLGLAEQSRREGVEFRFRTEVVALEVRAGQVAAVLTRTERLTADRYIIAAGSYGTPLLEAASIQLPVRPVKGYSVTLGYPVTSRSLRIPVVDDDFHAVVVPMRGAIRVAGTAEFAGYDRTPNSDRTHNLLRLLHKVLPEERLDLASAMPWSGLRPMSVDGLPIIGPTPLPNLWVNTGHGHLGWTMAAGSAQLLTDLIAESTPAIDPSPFAFARFK